MRPIPTPSRAWRVRRLVLPSPGTARRSPGPRSRVRVDWPVAGVLATAAVLVALACPASQQAARLGSPRVPSGLAVSESLAAMQPGVLPARGPGSGAITADRPNPAPTALAALAAPVLAARSGRRRSGRPGGSHRAQRPSHGVAGGPRAPPLPRHPC